LKPIVAMLAKTTLVVVALILAVFYFRLGWFLALAWPLGAAIALAVCWRDIRASPSRPLAVAIVLGTYTAVAVGVWKSGVDRKSVREFDMTWQDNGERNAYGEAEVVLQFERFPGNYVGIYSDELRDHLKQSAARPLRVTFEVTHDFGCMRGFHETRVGDLASWRSAGGYAGVVGRPASPWGSDPWWCP
jgi:hypothetical protein